MKTENTDRLEPVRRSAGFAFLRENRLQLNGGFRGKISWLFTEIRTEPVQYSNCISYSVDVTSLIIS